MECKLQVQLGRGNELNVKVWLLFLDGREAVENSWKGNCCATLFQLIYN